jgi:3-mercaptopyruvate sulfurtransferase SseA
LAGIERRVLESEIPALSAPFVGKMFKGREARALLAYLKTLPGEKGFEEPGWLFSPALLSKKAPSVAEVRVLDARSGDAYLAGHIPNALRWNLAENAQQALPASAAALAEELGQLGVSPETLVVIYDATAGPTAATAWWQLVQIGHQRVAILDGGWRRWVAEGYSTTTQVPTVQPAAPYPHSSMRLSDPTESIHTLQVLRLEGLRTTSDGVSYDWRATLAPEGFRRAEEIRSYLEEAGVKPPAVYRVEGSVQELAHLIFVLHLLGYDGISYDPEDRLLYVGARVPIEPFGRK